jgi:hypothetical protein
VPTAKSDLHVMPIQDLREHEHSRECWCRPRIETGEQFSVPVVVHNAMDGRELVEVHGVQ